MSQLDVAFAVPGDIEAATGGYAYARQVLRHLPAHGITGHHIELPGSFPYPNSDDLKTTARLLAQIHPNTPLLFDGLAYGALPEAIIAEIESPIVALVHHPLAREAGLSQAQQQAFSASERRALHLARAIITTSPMTASTITSDFDIRSDRITVAEPGTAPARRAIGTKSPVTIMAVGALIPRKGYAVLIEALSQLTKAGLTDWQCMIVGTPEHDTAEANRLREQIMVTGLRSHITLAGRIDAEALTDAYARADMFVLPSLYEGYGMVLAEAMARGLPIVCTTGGAAADTAPECTALKVPPGDTAAFAASIRTMLEDDEQRSRMADASWAAGQELPRWHDSVGHIAGVLKACTREASQ